MCWGWDRVAPIGRDKAEFEREIHRERHQGHVKCIGYAFNVWVDLVCQGFLVFLIVCFLSLVKSVELAKTQVIRTREIHLYCCEVWRLLFLFRLMWCAYSKHLAWVLWRRDGSADMIRCRCQAYSFLLWPNMSLSVYTFAELIRSLNTQINIQFLCVYMYLMHTHFCNSSRQKDRDRGRFLKLYAYVHHFVSNVHIHEEMCTRACANQVYVLQSCVKHQLTGGTERTRSTHRVASRLFVRSL